VAERPGSARKSGPARSPDGEPQRVAVLCRDANFEIQNQRFPAVLKSGGRPRPQRPLDAADDEAASPGNHERRCFPLDVPMARRSRSAGTCDSPARVLAAEKIDVDLAAEAAAEHVGIGDEYFSEPASGVSSRSCRFTPTASVSRRRERPLLLLRSRYYRSRSSGRLPVNSTVRLAGVGGGGGGDEVAVRETERKNTCITCPAPGELDSTTVSSTP